jgi:heat shock protein HslJ
MKIDQLSIYSLLLLLGGCAVAVEKMPPPDLAEIGVATVAGLFDEPITLSNGRWENNERASAGIASDFLLSGDLNGDGIDETVALMWTSNGGSGTRNFVTVFGRDDGEVTNIATAPIGDRVQVRRVQIIAETIVLDVVQHGPEDAMCCPGETATRKWSLQGDQLIEGEQQVNGRLSLADLENIEWRLLESAADNVTLSFSGDNVSGQGPCNRYFGTVTAGDAVSELTIGPLASTQMMCPGEAMQQEKDYLDALSSVIRFSFNTTRLTLTAQQGDKFKHLIFAAVE